MALFSSTKDWTDDDPQDLFEFAESDFSIRDLCNAVYWASYKLEAAAARGKDRFAAPVDPKFLLAWRDFENRYKATVDQLYWSSFEIDLSFFNIPSHDDGVHDAPKNKSAADEIWDDADFWAEDEATRIDYALRASEERISQTSFDRADFSLFEEGLSDQRLRAEAGVDLRGIIRRRALVPFILVPRHIAAKHGNGAKLSMLNNLRQAHDAFIFGVPYAALALMRSISEDVLREHFRAEGKDLNERIDNVRNRLPAGASAAALHRLRKLANVVLHLKRDEDEGLSIIDDKKLEMEIVSLLKALGALIEGADR